MGAALPRRMFMTSGPSSSHSVCLTFDDGPHARHTARILDVLQAHDVPATFFVIGKAAEAAPQLLQRIVHEGHCLAHHSYSHSDPTETSARQLSAEIHRTQAVFERAVRRTSRLFRPPHGKLTVGKFFRVWLGGQSVVLWNRDPKDFSLASAADVISQFEAMPLGGGDVVLLHDNVGHTADALPELIANVRSRGLGFEIIENWVRPAPGSIGGTLPAGEVPS
jgi:peptidoglycan-N-acetylglucosamine deacetylase